MYLPVTNTSFIYLYFFNKSVKAKLIQGGSRLEKHTPSLFCLVWDIICYSSVFAAASPPQSTVSVMKHLTKPVSSLQKVIRIINISESTTPSRLLSNLSSCSTLHFMLPLFIYWWSRWWGKHPAGEAGHEAGESCWWGWAACTRGRIEGVLEICPLPCFTASCLGWWWGVGEGGV